MIGNIWWHFWAFLAFLSIPFLDITLGCITGKFDMRGVYKMWKVSYERGDKWGSFDRGLKRNK